MAQKIVDGLPFFGAGGILVPPGSVVTIPDEVEADKNLKDMGERPTLIPAEVAAIGPTGPYPTAPQQVPPGAIQTVDGYASGPHLFVGPGSELLKTPAADQDATGVADDAPTRAPRDDAQISGGGEVFDASAVIAGNVPDVTPRLTGLDAAQLDAVAQAENAGGARAGVIKAVEDARAKLA